MSGITERCDGPADDKACDVVALSAIISDTRKSLEQMKQERDEAVEVRNKWWSLYRKGQDELAAANACIKDRDKTIDDMRTKFDVAVSLPNVTQVACAWCRRMHDEMGGVIGPAGITLPVCLNCKHDHNATGDNVRARYAASHLPMCGECHGDGWYFPAGEPGRNYTECVSCGQTGHLAAKIKTAKVPQ